MAYCRLEEQLVHRGALPEEMFGFISKHGQNHALYTAYESIKHNRRIGKTVVVCSADVRKAYPSMNRAQMLHELKQLGVGNNLVHASASMYEDNRSQVLTSEDRVTSTEYSVENGLREGAVCSPLLYVVFCTGLIKKLKSGPTAALGMTVGSEWMGAQMWADDLLLMTAHESAAVAKQQMAQMQEVLLADAHEKNYAYSKAKTQMLVIDGTAATEQELQNEADLKACRPVHDSANNWPMGTQVSALKFRRCGVPGGAPRRIA